jgi:hypothetical protein
MRTPVSMAGITELLDEIFSVMSDSKFLSPDIRHKLIEMNQLEL